MIELRNIIKIEIIKEVLKKSGFDNDIGIINSIADCVKNDRFIFDIIDNEVVIFVTWECPQEIEGKKWVFINNFWIDPRYRGSNYVIRIRTYLRGLLKDTRAIWFNNKKNKPIDRR